MLASRLRVAASTSTKTTTALRSLSTNTKPVVPRIVDRNPNETGPGGRGSDAGLKVAVFGASGFLGRYVCCHLGTSVCVGIMRFGFSFGTWKCRFTIKFGGTWCCLLRLFLLKRLEWWLGWVGFFFDRGGDFTGKIFFSSCSKSLSLE